MGTWQRWRRTIVEVVARSPREHDASVLDDDPVEIEVELDAR